MKNIKRKFIKQNTYNFGNNLPNIQKTDRKKNILLNSRLNQNVSKIGKMKFETEVNKNDEIINLKKEIEKLKNENIKLKKENEDPKEKLKIKKI